MAKIFMESPQANKKETFQIQRWITSTQSHQYRSLSVDLSFVAEQNRAKLLSAASIQFKGHADDCEPPVMLLRNSRRSDSRR